MSLGSQLAKAENNLQDAKTRFVTGWVIFGGGFLGMFASAAAMDSGVSFGTGFLFMIILGGIAMSGLVYGGDNGEAAQEEIDRLKRAISNEKQRKRKQENQRRDRDLKRRRDQENRDKELNLANQLMKEGGIENLNKAIGIFEKYE